MSLGVVVLLTLWVQASGEPCFADECARGEGEDTYPVELLQLSHSVLSGNISSTMVELPVSMAPVALVQQPCGSSYVYTTPPLSTCECTPPYYDFCPAMEPAVYPSNTAFPSTMKSCTPQCTWSCEESKCDEVCEPVCETPKCETRCDRMDTSGCTIECDGTPDCAVICPENVCPTGGCPQCEAKCTNEPTCKLNCPAAQSCKYMCEAPRCDWKCREPKVCPEPKCEMKCEEPPNCAQTSARPLPPLCPGEISVESFAMPTAEANSSSMAQFVSVRVMSAVA